MALKPEILFQMILNCHWLVCILGAGLTDRSIQLPFDITDRVFLLPPHQMLRRGLCVISTGRRTWTRSDGTLTAALTVTACKARPCAQPSAVLLYPAISRSLWRAAAAPCVQVRAYAMCVHIEIRSDDQSRTD